MAPSAHAKLSPSAAKRWLTCPGSVHLTPKVLDAGSKAADQGTAGHLLFEKCLRLGKSPKFYLGEKLKGVEVTEEMVGWVDDAIRWVKQYLEENPGSILFNEQEVDIGPAFGLPVTEDGKTNFWGTGDLFIISPRRLVVFDLKLGYVDVEALGNDQLRSYAVGFELKHQEFEFEEILLVIHQPRSGGAKEAVIAAKDLHAWRDDVRPKVLAATDPNAPLVPSEDACRWCHAAAMCPALKEHALEMAKSEFKEPETLSMEELCLVLEKADMIRGALKSYEGHALRLLALGQGVPGWKRVKGRKNRVWKDEKGAVAALRKLGYKEDDYNPRSLVTPAQGEKLIGRGGKELLAKFIETPEGEPTLAPATDPRPALPGEFEALP